MKVIQKFVQQRKFQNQALLALRNMSGMQDQKKNSVIYMIYQQTRLHDLGGLKFKDGLLYRDIVRR